MPTITISRQLGSLGYQIARQIADRLGYRLVWRELINQAAQRAGVPEMALETIDELGLLGVKPTAEAQAAYSLAVQQVMEELAETGQVVIVGRAGQVILRGRADAVHVRVIAPLELRAMRVAHARNISLRAARAQVTTSDRTRRLYLSHNYQADWDDPDLYDLVLNTARLTSATATELVVRAIELRSIPTHPPSQPEIQIECE
jgi:cytidylate kinase